MKKLLLSTIVLLSGIANADYQYGGLSNDQLCRVDSANVWSIGGQVINSSQTSIANLTIASTTGQLADLLDFKNSSGTILSSINASGQFVGDGSLLTGVSGGGGGGVTSVYTRTGAVIAATNDYTWAQINKNVSSLNDITTKFIQTSSASNVGLIIASTTAQTANLISVQNSTGTVLAGLNSSFKWIGDGSILSNLPAGLVTTGTRNTFGGTSAGALNISTDNTYIGDNAGSGATSSSGKNGNTFLGSQAGKVTNEEFNVMVGFNAGKANTSGYWNTFLGKDAGAANTNGIQNVCIGTRSCDLANSSGNSNNAYIGVDSAVSNDGGHNVGVGKGSIAGTGNDDVTALGYAASFSNNVDNAIAIGSGATVTGTNGIAIGFGATAAANNITLGISTNKVGIAGTVPTAYLHVPACTTAAGTASIKIPAGTLMTTPEDGALEYDGTHLYFTIGVTRKQLDN